MDEQHHPIAANSNNQVKSGGRPEYLLVSDLPRLGSKPCLPCLPCKQSTSPRVVRKLHVGGSRLVSDEREACIGVIREK